MQSRSDSELITLIYYAVLCLRYPHSQNYVFLWTDVDVIYDILVFSDTLVLLLCQCTSIVRGIPYSIELLRRCFSIVWALGKKSI
jgi:hypothetical protein